jgi:hypothetical protein
MAISLDMIVRVAHADVAMRMGFPRSVAYWHREGSKARWKVLPGDCGPLLIGKNDGVVIDGDCSNEVAAPEGGTIHIHGDLKSRIEANGHYEVVVTGDVLPEGRIDASGHCQVFVGGRMLGAIRSTDSATLWIESDFDGSIKTGTPMTELYVGRDFRGGISPHEKASLLSVRVGGFAPHALLAEIVECGYTQFQATVGRSDVPPGLYPLDEYHRKSQRGGSSWFRWCVEAGDGT